MSVYLYNLIFSLNGSDCAAGRFQQYPSILPPNATISSISCAWFEYMLAGTPFGLGPYYQTVGTVLDPTNWGNPHSDVNGLDLDPGDYLMIRIASTDSNVKHYQTRFTGVFGRGTSQTLPAGAGDLQSPLVLSSAAAPSSTLPRTVIDSDGSAGTSWPGPIVSDGSWVVWLGEVVAAPNNDTNDYTMNVGASIYVNANPPSAGNTFTFGKDPKMQVGGAKKPKREGKAA
jgi:hypothetical protein